MSMDNVSILIKPVSGICNLRCTYCFYRDEPSGGNCRAGEVMNAETLEKIIESAFAAAGKNVCFTFQGGEPTLAGLEFFEEFIRLEHKHARSGVTVQHSIQTNGSLLDEKWADYFVKNGFLVSLSIDGVRELHDMFRPDADGGSSWKSAERGLQILITRGVDVNALCVVTRAMSRRAQSVYYGLKRMGVNFIQFIPCLDPPGEQPGETQYSLTPERYGSFLKTLFDLWYRDWENEDYTGIRLFDDYVHLLIETPVSSCAAAGICGQYIVTEHDGSLYPCDYYARDEWGIGNIADAPLEELAGSDKAKEFMTQSLKRPEECHKCKWLLVCRGGCMRYFVQTEDGVRNYYCEAYKALFEYAMPRLAKVAKAEKAFMEQEFYG